MNTVRVAVQQTFSTALALHFTFASEEILCSCSKTFNHHLAISGLDIKNVLLGLVGIVLAIIECFGLAEILKITESQKFSG